MADIEKVIKGLECCRIDENRHINCADCPYYTDDDKGQMWCSNEINNDALELLKEKKPRLLTLEEVKQAEVVWNEWTSVDGFVECMMFDRVDADGDYRFTEKLGSQIYFEPSEYNESWRCWSARPAAEQMKETEWDGDGQ